MSTLQILAAIAFVAFMVYAAVTFSVKCSTNGGVVMTDALGQMRCLAVKELAR